MRGNWSREGKVVGSAVIIAKQDELEARKLICSAWQPGNQARAGPSRQESQGCNQMDSRQVRQGALPQSHSESYPNRPSIRTPYKNWHFVSHSLQELTFRKFFRIWHLACEFFNLDISLSFSPIALFSLFFFILHAMEKDGLGPALSWNF